MLSPTILLDSKSFHHSYASKHAVVEANDLSPNPLAPCLNVMIQDNSMYNSLT